MILHGMTEVAGQGYYTVKGLNEIGLEANMAVLKYNPHGYPVDIDLNVDRKPALVPLYAFKIFKFFLRSIRKYDIFHFHFARTLLPNGWDLFFLKRLKKKVFVEFHGSEIRWKFNRSPLDENTFGYLQGLPPVSNKNLEKLSKLCNSADGIILHDSELLSHLPITETKVFYLPLRIDISRFKANYPEDCQKKVVIVHAPSKRSVKGTEYVIKAVEELKLKYDLEFILVENMTNDKAVEVYGNADVIVDQLLIGTYGVFACEAMALGKPVITYVSEEMKKDFPTELPIISSTIYTIKDVLEKLILNPRLRRETGINGRHYVEKYHDFKKIAVLTNDIYSNRNLVYTQREAFERVSQECELRS